MTMGKIFQNILLSVAAFVAASCAGGLDNAAVTVGGDGGIRFVVGDFPAFGESSTRAVGTGDPGKTSWAEGDEILVKLEGSKQYGTQCVTLVKTSAGWNVKDNQTLKYAENESGISVKAFYAPDYTFSSDGGLVLKSDNVVAGIGECIYVEGQLTWENNNAITLPFATATREYSRLRIATIPEVDINVSVEYFTPAGSGSRLDETSYALHSDAKGNAYLYGGFTKNATVSVKYGNVVLTEYTFKSATSDGSSYVLDATVVSMMNPEEIEAVGQKIADEVSAGKTRFNIRLAAEPGIDVFDSIKGWLEEAASIDLTFMGCEKIPSSAFKYWTMLKSISLPDVTVIGESAFSMCYRLQKVVFGSPLTRVYGASETSGGIFENCGTELMIYLVLSSEQNQMSFRQIEWEGVWTAVDGQLYKESSGHMYSQFLGYTFRSVSCGGKTH